MQAHNVPTIPAIKAMTKVLKPLKQKLLKLDFLFY